MKTQFKISALTSSIEWVGRKVTGSHDGTINVQKGNLIFAQGQLIGGTFSIDTTSIKILDITDPATNAQFASHLASEDFFNSSEYPEATFEIFAAEPRGKGSYHIVGNLTIKDQTHSIAFDAEVLHTNESVTATAKITIDRTKFDMKFRSGNFFTNLGDTLIYNHFDLNVALKANAEVAIAQTI